MGRSPCCEENGLKKGPWTPEEDEKLVQYIQNHGLGSWRALPRLAGLNRCGKSCRLRWTNYLRPDIKRGKFSEEEEQTILHLHSILGNKWSTIATHLPGRTDNEIKNFWNTHLKKKLIQMGFDPMTHQPRTDLFSSLTNLIALANLRDQVQSLVDKQLYHPLMDLQLINNINNNNILVPQNDSNHQQLVINSLMSSVSHVPQALESRGSLVVPNNLAEYYHINGAISDPQPLHQHQHHHQHGDHHNVNASSAHAQLQQDVSFGSQPFSLNSMSTSSCHPDEIVLMSGDYHDHDHDQHHDGGDDSASWFDNLPNLIESDDQYETLGLSNNNNNVVDSINGGENTTTTATTTSTSNCLWSQTYF